MNRETATHEAEYYVDKYIQYVKKLNEIDQLEYLVECCIAKEEIQDTMKELMRFSSIPKPILEQIVLQGDTEAVEILIDNLRQEFLVIERVYWGIQNMAEERYGDDVFSFATSDIVSSIGTENEASEREWAIEYLVADVTETEMVEG